MHLLCNVCNGKTHSCLNFDVFGLQQATNQFKTSDKASYHVPSVGGIADARAQGPSGTGLNLSTTDMYQKKGS